MPLFFPYAVLVRIDVDSVCVFVNCVFVICVFICIDVDNVFFRVGHGIICFGADANHIIEDIVAKPFGAFIQGNIFGAFVHPAEQTQVGIFYTKCSSFYAPFIDAVSVGQKHMVGVLVSHTE